MKKHRHFETPIEKHKRKELAKHKQSKRRGRSRYWGNYLKIQSLQIEIASFFDTSDFTLTGDSISPRCNNRFSKLKLFPRTRAIAPPHFPNGWPHLCFVLLIKGRSPLVNQTQLQLLPRGLSWSIPPECHVECTWELVLVVQVLVLFNVALALMGSFHRTRASLSIISVVGLLAGSSGIFKNKLSWLGSNDVSGVQH